MIKKHALFRILTPLLLTLLVVIYSSQAQSDNSDSIQAVATEFGDPTSLYLLGRKYMRGDGVERDINKAVKWFTQAAQKNHLKASYELAKIYFEGKDEIETDFSLSAKWLLEPALRGNDDAQYKLGILYLNGQGVAKNPSQARDWLSKSASQDNVYALSRLGTLYAEGKILPKDQEKAKKLLGIAMELGDENAEILLEKIILKEKSKKREAELKKSPAKRYLQQANKGDVKAQFELAQSYLKGSNDLKKDMDEAIKWLAKAAAQDHAQAQYLLGNAYYQGKGTRKNTTKAKKWLKRASKLKHKKAKSLLNKIVTAEKDADKIAKLKKSPAYQYRIKAEQDDKEAQFKLGELYNIGGKGIAKDTDEAAKWYMRAAKLGHTESQYKLAKLAIEQGKIKNSIRWFSKAARQGHLEASFELGVIYTSGKGIKINYTEAMKWLQQAALAKHKKAGETIVKLYVDNKIDIHDITSVGEWLEAVAVSGNQHAQYLLANLHQDKNHELFNEQKAVKWFKRSAKQGLSNAQYRLALLYAKGKGTRRSGRWAAKWFEKAAKQGHMDAQYQLGLIYASGVGLSKSQGKAKKWIRAAADQGHSDAKLKLNNCSPC